MRFQLTLVISAALTMAASNGAFAAGTVTMASDGFGGVTLTGDGDANKIKVSDTDANNDWTVAGSGGTLINGMPSVQTGVLTGGINIELGAGNDQLKLWDGTLGARLRVLMGAGEDKASISDVTVTEFVHIEGNTDSDKIKVQTIQVSDVGNAFFSSIDADDAGGTGTGDDSVKIKGFVDQGIYVNLGAGADKASAQEVTASSFLEVNSGSERDKVQLKTITTGELDAETGAGDKDSLKVQSCVAPVYTFSDSAGINDVYKEKNNTLGAGTVTGFGD
jgi:hypothetical protein